jgi:predicted permease
MMERTLMALAAAAAIAAAAAVGVFSAFFALYALVEPQLGAPGAAAVVAASAAILVALAGFIAARKVEGDRRETTTATPDATMVDTILSLVRERPLLASGAAVAAGIYALRNPQLIAAVLRAFMDKPSNPKR